MKATRCRCGADIHTDWDDHGIPATIDPTALTVYGECMAVLAGRRTFDVIPASKRHPAEVWRRTRHLIGKRVHGTLHAAHVCGQPIPAAWAAPPDHIVITHQPDPDVCPF